MNLEDLEAWEEKAFALRLDLGVLAGKLKKNAELYEEGRARLNVIRISLESGVMDKEETEPARLAQLALFG